MKKILTTRSTCKEKVKIEFCNWIYRLQSGLFNNLKKVHCHPQGLQLFCNYSDFDQILFCNWFYTQFALTFPYLSLLFHAGVSKKNIFVYFSLNFYVKTYFCLACPFLIYFTLGILWILIFFYPTKWLLLWIEDDENPFC